MAKLTVRQLMKDGRSRDNLRHGLTAGALPDKCKYIEAQMNHLRRKLEDAVVDLKGKVTLPDAASIQTAIKWERHGALALRWLRIEYNQLKPLERLMFSREVAKAGTERDKCIRELKLDRDTLRDAWTVLDAKTLSVIENHATR